MQSLADVINVGLQGFDAPELLLQANHQIGAQQVSLLGAGDFALNSLEQLVVSCRQCDAELGQDATQCVGLHDAHLHELAAHAVQRHADLLLFGLDGHRLNVGLLRSHPDRLRIHGIGLVTQQEGLDVLRWQQFDLVTQRGDYACLVVRCGTRLHCYQA